MPARSCCLPRPVLQIYTIYAANICFRSLWASSAFPDGLQVRSFPDVVSIFIVPYYEHIPDVHWISDPLSSQVCPRHFLTGCRLDRSSTDVSRPLPFGPGHWMCGNRTGPEELHNREWSLCAGWKACSTSFRQVCPRPRSFCTIVKSSKIMWVPEPLLLSEYRCVNLKFTYYK